MDVIGACGYVGQAVQFIGIDKIGYVSGTGICIHDVLSGPKEIIWRPEMGIKTYKYHDPTCKLALSYDTNKSNIEVMYLTGNSRVRTLPNPSAGKVIDLSFSYDGEHLTGLSDFFDHKLVIWDMSSEETIVIADLVDVYESCIVNPINKNLLILYSSDGLSVVEVKELFGEYSVNFKDRELESLRAIQGEKQPDEITPFVQSQSWATETLTYIGLATGHVVALDTTVDGYLFFFSLPSNKPDHRFPTCLTLTADHLIVGDSVGYISWYAIDQLNAFVAQKSGFRKVELTPKQVCLLPSEYPTCIAIDDMFRTVIIGSRIGSIFRLSVAIKELDEEPSLEEEHEADAAARAAITVVLEPPKAMLTAEAEAILASRFFELKIAGIVGGKPKASANSTSLLMTGSHSGTMSFWRSPVVMGSEAEPEALSLRRSVPGTLMLCKKTIMCPEDTSSITAMEPFPSGCKQGGGRFVMVGNATGFVEIWLVEVVEDEDEDVVEESNDESGQMKVVLTRVFSQKLFKVAVTTISMSSNFPYIAVSSFQDSNVYVIDSSSTTFQVVGFVDTLTLNLISSFWVDSSLSLVSRTGTIFAMHPIAVGASIKALTVDTAAASKVLSSVGKISSCCNSGHGILLVCDDDSKTLKKFELTDISVFVESSVVYDDVMTSSSISRSGQLCVTGGIFGTLYVWKVDGLEQVAVVRLHKTMVLSISLCSDSSLVYSNSSDGSIFILSLDKLLACKPHEYKSMLEYKENDLRKNVVEDSIAVELWSDRYRQDMLVAVKEENRAKVSNCREALQVLSGRLINLLQKNESVNDLEKLDRAEFVVDIDGRNDILESYKVLANDLQDSFTATNNYNEAVAARVRQLAWDAMEAHSSVLLPLQPEMSGQLQVSSFAVQKYSDSQLQKLDKIKRLRAIEIRTQRSNSLSSSVKLGSGCIKTSWMNTTPTNSTWIMGDGLKWPTFDVVEQLLTAMSAPVDAIASEAIPDLDEESGESSSGDKLIDESSVLYLLYPPLSMRTEVQKRMQITLMGGVLHMIKLKFNEHFKKLFREKEDVLAAIESRNNRIQEILGELRTTEELYKPSLADEEIAESVITVKDAELVNRPYESATAKAVRLKLEEDKRRRELEQAEDNVKGRALDEMMGGTLEVKKGVFADANSMHRPDWMSILTPAEMNEGQLKEYEEFENKLKLIHEEQTKYRKALEVEMKKLKMDISDSCKSFDDKLIMLSKYKLITQREVLTHELSMARLALQLVQQDYISSELSEANEKASSFSIESSSVKEMLAKVSARAESLKNQVAVIQEDGRNMERTFKRDLQTLCNLNFDQDTLKVFTELYRQRQYGDEFPDDGEDDGDVDDDKSEATSTAMSSRGTSKNNSKAGKGSSKKSSNQTSKAASKMKASKGISQNKEVSLGPLQEAAQAMGNQPNVDKVAFRDPFFKARLKIEKSKRAIESKIPLLVAQSIDVDCPEGFTVDQFTWSKLQELRSLRIQKEIDEKVMVIRYSDVKNRLDEIQAADSQLDTKLSSLNDAIISIKQKKKALENNLEIIVALKQGQDEVDKDALVTTYEDAFLLPTSVILKYNASIKEFGKEKIGVLSKIKSFRRHINTIDWELNHLQLQAWHLDEYFTDLQLLRVTRDFQRVIRAGNDNVITKGRIEKLMTRKDYISKDVESKLELLLETNVKVSKEISTKEEENIRLLTSIQDMRKDVETREMVKKCRDNARGKAGEAGTVAMKRMQKVVAKRQLLDATRANAEEMELLRQELEKIRQKTFPSFVRAARQRTFVNPDER